MKLSILPAGNSRAESIVANGIFIPPAWSFVANVDCGVRYSLVSRHAIVIFMSGCLFLILTSLNNRELFEMAKVLFLFIKHSG